jgi:hypothetical protein
MMQPKQTLRRRVIKWTSILLLAGLIITCNYLSNKVDAFKCDIVHGSDHLPGWSNTKSEAIKRTTYVCAALLTYQPFDKKSPMQLKPLRGWVESSWRSGFWYLTTTKDTGSDINYRILIDDTGDKRHWLARSPLGTEMGEEFLNFNTTYPPDQFEAHVDRLPKSNTLYYNVLKKDTLDSTSKNIEGVMTIRLLRH